MTRRRLLGYAGALMAAGLVRPARALAQDADDPLTYAPRAAPPPGYPAAYAATVRAGENEGRLAIYAATDLDVAAPLIEDFRRLYPRIDVAYEDLNTTVLHHRFIAENQLDAESADIVWSSAMDQQAVLVKGGYAQAYATPEKAHLPEWAVWNDQAFATTYEPVVIGYNKRLIAAGEVPRTRGDLVRLLTADPARFKGKVVSYDIQKSGVGFFLAAQDAANSAEFWAVARALGQNEARLELTTGAMVAQIRSGDALIGYNLLGGYTIAQARASADLGFVLPADHTLVMSRMMLISRKAAHPNAARLWVDYVLSGRGQSVVANQARLYAIRTDIEGETTASRLKAMLGASERPLAASPDLTGPLERSTYRNFIIQWQQALQRR